MPKRGIPPHSIGRMFGKMGSLRVSKASKQALAVQLEQWTTEIAKRAVMYMKHARRKTLLEEDVERAIEDVFRH